MAMRLRIGSDPHGTARSILEAIKKQDWDQLVTLMAWRDVPTQIILSAAALLTDPPYCDDVDDIAACFTDGKNSGFGVAPTLAYVLLHCLSDKVNHEAWALEQKPMDNEMWPLQLMITEQRLAKLRGDRRLDLEPLVPAFVTVCSHLFRCAAAVRGWAKQVNGDLWGEAFRMVRIVSLMAEDAAQICDADTVLHMVWSQKILSEQESLQTFTALLRMAVREQHNGAFAVDFSGAFPNLPQADMFAMLHWAVQKHECPTLSFMCLQVYLEALKTLPAMATMLGKMDGAPVEQMALGTIETFGNEARVVTTVIYILVEATRVFENRRTLHVLHQSLTSIVVSREVTKEMSQALLRLTTASPENRVDFLWYQARLDASSREAWWKALLKRFPPATEVVECEDEDEDCLSAHPLGKGSRGFVLDGGGGKLRLESVLRLLRNGRGLSPFTRSEFTTEDFFRAHWEEIDSELNLPK